MVAQLVDLAAWGEFLSSIIVWLVVFTTLPAFAVAAGGFLRAYVLFPVATERAQERATRAALIGMYGATWFMVSCVLWIVYVAEVLD